MRQFLTTVSLILAIGNCAIANDTTPTRGDTRRVSVFWSMGFLEITSLGVNIQFSEQYSVGLVASGFILGGPSYMFPNTAPGVGIRGSYYFSRSGEEEFEWANVINADVQCFFRVREDNKLGLRDPCGVGIEAIVGRDGIIGSGVGILWGIGIAASIHSEEPPLVFPAFRLGLHFDL